MIKKFSLLIILLSLGFTFACNDDDDEPDYGTSARLSGRVNLYDEGDTPQPKDSMVVSIYGAKPPVADTTDVNGRFSFPDVDYGLYSIVYEKPGYGRFILNNVSHQKGDTEIGIIPDLGQFSTTMVDSISDSVSGAVITIRVVTTPAGTTNKPRYLRFFFGDNSNVSFEDFIAYSSVVTAPSNPYIYSISMHKLLDWGFKPGDHIWIKAYGDSKYSNHYIDPLKGIHIFPNLNLHSAAAVYFVMP
jgi:hypothetical protein